VLEQVIRCARLAAAFSSGDDIPAQFRHPLLDRDLIAFMFSVPWPEKTHPTCDRLLQRRALESALPRKVLLRKNKISPEEAFYAGLAEGGDWLDWLADRPRIVERGYVDAAAWRSALAQARLANTAGVRYFQAAASLEAGCASEPEKCSRPPPLLRLPSTFHNGAYASLGVPAQIR